MKQLNMLVLTANFIAEIEPKHLPPSLLDLHLAMNQLAAVPAGLPDLIALDLSKNKIKKIDHLPASLEDAYFSGN